MTARFLVIFMFVTANQPLERYRGPRLISPYRFESVRAGFIEDIPLHGYRGASC